VRVIVVASDGGRPSMVASDGGRESTSATATSVTKVDTTAAAVTAVARFKRSEIQTHYFLTLDRICWAAF